MKLETFFKKFEMFADAPNAVVKMRELVLQLAVQGKLVPQDPNDEPAPALLDQITAHKTALANEGKLRSSTNVKSMTAEEAEFDIPSNWSFVRFGEIMVNRDGERIPVSKEERETKAKTYDYYGASGVIDKIDGYLFDKPLLLIGEDGANLINRSTPIAFIARGKYWVNNHAHVLDGISEDFLKFIELHINAINLEKYITGTAQPKMNQAKMNSIPIALPPLAEQKRIVAKVDILMALCDRLEAQQQEREEKHKALSRASLARFADAPTPANLQFIFHPSYTIAPADLRKSILTLAVQGKLVPQDPNDEPAEILLRKIGDEKRTLLAEKLLKKSQTPENSIDSTDGFSLPTTWRWAKSDDLFFTTKLAGFEYTDHMRLTDYGEVPVIRAQNVKPEGILKTHLKFIDGRTSEALPRSALTKPALLVTFIGAGIGDVAIFDEPDRWHLAPNVAKMEPFNVRGKNLSIQYLLLFMQSPFGRSEIFKHLKSTAQPSISMATIRDIDVPVPPLAEQRRIVAKVDELMKLVDALETQLAASRATAANLLAALVAELTGTPNTGKVSVPASTNTGTGTSRRGRPPKS